MNIAYLILAHAHPEQLIRMIGALRSPGATFAVHVDGRAEPSMHAEIAAYAAKHEDVLLATPQSCYWGTYALVQATLECVSVLMASGRPFDYSVLLSGQDYPVKPLHHLADFFAQRQGTEFIETFPLDAPNRWTLQGGRFQAQARVKRYTLNLRSRILQLPLPRRYPLCWHPHGGSQWWALSHEALAWVMHMLNENPQIARFFRHTFIPDEAMFQTMLANSPFAKSISNEPLHYIDWERPNPNYPRTLDVEDFYRIATSPALFARKVHPQRSATLLERVDKDLLGHESS